MRRRSIPVISVSVLGFLSLALELAFEVFDGFRSIDQVIRRLVRVVFRWPACLLDEVMNDTLDASLVTYFLYFPLLREVFDRPGLRDRASS